MILMPTAAVHVNSAQTQEQPKIQTSLLALARSGIGYEIFNEAVDRGYIRSKTLGENEMEWVLNLARMKKVRMYVLDCGQGI